MLTFFHLRVFSWRTTHPVALKSIAKVPNEKVARRPKCFLSSSSDGLVQICMTLSWWFSHKTAAFFTEQCTIAFFFPGLKSHEVIRTTHWRTMASFTTPFFFTCMHAHKYPMYLNVERYVGWGCTRNCFMLSSLPCFYAFCWSAIPTSCYIFNDFYSCEF